MIGISGSTVHVHTLVVGAGVLLQVHVSPFAVRAKFHCR